MATTQLGVRLEDSLVDDIDRVKAKLDRLHGLVAANPVTRHAVMIESIALGVAALEKRVDRQLGELGA